MDATAITSATSAGMTGLGGPQILAPAIAALVVDLSGYHALFVTGAAFALVGSLLVIPIKSVR